MADMRKKILVVDDEVKIASFIEMELQHEGFKTEYAGDGLRAYEMITNPESGYDLILLDWMLPGMSGLEVCKKVREVSDVPIIMLTARGDIKDRVTGLAAGADDYLAKPFAIEELLGRIKNRLRIEQRADYDLPQNDILSSGDVVLETASRIVRLNGTPVSLTKKEFTILELLLRSKNIVVPRSKIIAVAWGENYREEANSLDVYIRYLRQKLEDANDHKKLIYTIRGVGYVVKD